MQLPLEIFDMLMRYWDINTILNSRHISKSYNDFILNYCKSKTKLVFWISDDSGPDEYLSKLFQHPDISTNFIFLNSKSKIWQTNSRKFEEICGLFPNITELRIYFQTHRMGCDNQHRLISRLLHCYQHSLEKLYLHGMICSTEMRCRSSKKYSPVLSLNRYGVHLEKLKHLHVNLFSYIDISQKCFPNLEVLELLNGNNIEDPITGIFKKIHLKCHLDKSLVNFTTDELILHEDSLADLQENFLNVSFFQWNLAYFFHEILE